MDLLPVLHASGKALPLFLSTVNHKSFCQSSKQQIPKLSFIYCGFCYVFMKLSETGDIFCAEIKEAVTNEVKYNRIAQPLSTGLTCPAFLSSS